jgi:hypothetical protein
MEELIGAPRDPAADACAGPAKPARQGTPLSVVTEQQP